MAEYSGNGSWYALWTRHQHEKAAATILRNKGFEIFLPLYAVSSKWADRTKQVSFPLFPGYIFLREGLDRWLQIVTTPGVCGIVGWGGRPAAIAHSEIEGVRRMIESTLRVQPHPFLKTGDWVRVKSGPLAGLEGILVREKNFSRVVLSVEILGKSAAVEVDVTATQRILSRTLGSVSETRASVPEGLQLIATG
jgi:transcription antitermination factor NusG